MKLRLALAFVFCLLAAPVHALTLGWTPNTEPDMHHYNLYACPTAPAICNVKLAAIPFTPTTNTFVIADPLRTTSYALKAVDLAGNESALSNTVTRTVAQTGNDTTAPGAPQTLIIK